ncbi:MAG: hypothetical protein ACJ75B_14295 [Flavisolibacter sp.]
MAKAKKKSAKEASNTFHNIMQASVKGNPKPNDFNTSQLLKMEALLKSKIESIRLLGSSTTRGLSSTQRKEMLERLNMDDSKYEIKDGEIRMKGDQ